LQFEPTRDSVVNIRRRTHFRVAACSRDDDSAWEPLPYHPRARPLTEAAVQSLRARAQPTTGGGGAGDGDGEGWRGAATTGIGGAGGEDDDDDEEMPTVWG
jgi:hypothetical protein